MNEPIYLDANATTPLHPRVREAMQTLLGEPLGNPSSLHRHGRRARDVVEAAREKVARLLGAHPAEIFFTSGGTESNHLFLHGCPDPEDSPMWISPYEHPSIREPARRAWANGRRGGPLPGSESGRLDLESVGPIEADSWVSLQWVNNETGVVQELSALIDSLRERGVAAVHTDGAQGFFRLTTTVDELGVDAATITAHKSFGPVGVGALYLRTGTIIDPSTLGGPQERSVRPGTENLLAIHGMGALAELALQEELWPREKLVTLRDRFQEGVETLEGCSRLAAEADTYPNCVAVALEDLDADSVLARLDRAAVSASSGSACSAGVGAASTVLAAMGHHDRRIRGALRFSFTPDLEPDTMTEAARRFVEVVRQLRSERGNNPPPNTPQTRKGSS